MRPASWAGVLGALSQLVSPSRLLRVTVWSFKFGIIPLHSYLTTKKIHYPVFCTWSTLESWCDGEHYYIKQRGTNTQPVTFRQSTNQPIYVRRERRLHYILVSLMPNYETCVGIEIQPCTQQEFWRYEMYSCRPAAREFRLRFHITGSSCAGANVMLRKT